MNSIELVRQLYRRGTITKEAALSLLERREKLIKAALATEATRLVERVVGATKEASLFDSLRRGGGQARSPAGFFAKLRQGGLTPSKEPAIAWNDVGSNLLKMLGIAGLSAAATAGAGAVLKYRRDRSLQGEIARSYDRMFEEYPDLREGDSERVRRHFGVLAKFAPSLAADPTVAGTFVSVTAPRAMIEPATIQMLAQTQRRIDEMHEGRSALSQHFDRGLGIAQKALSPIGGSKLGRDA